MSDTELAVARAAVDAAPADARLRYRLAQLQEDARDLPAALESVRTAIKLSPDYAENGVLFDFSTGATRRVIGGASPSFP